jgi:hypothetical protein
VWVPDGKLVRSIPVQIGMSDGTNTEIASSDLKEGALVIVGEVIKEAAAPQSAASPFTPQLFGGRGQPSR